MSPVLPTRNEVAAFVGQNQRMVKWFEDANAFLNPEGTADATTYLNGAGAYADPFPNGKLFARVNFNGTGTVTIRSSANVVSITDNGVGDYTLNFFTPAVEANYTVCMAYSGEFNVQHGVGFIVSQTTTALRIIFHSPANSANTVDKSIVDVAIFR